MLIQATLEPTPYSTEAYDIVEPLRDAVQSVAPDTLVGGATTHVQSTPNDRRDALRADATRYADQLVDFLLSAVNAGPRP